MSVKHAPLAVLLTIALAAPAVAGMLGVERNVMVVAPWSPYGVAPYGYAAPVWYPPYLPYESGAFFRPPPFYGYSPEYVPGANWRDNWYDATRSKVHSYTLR